MPTELYEEYWIYEWKKSKAKLWEVEAVNTYKDLGDPICFKNGHFTYVLDEKQLYKVKHTRKLRYIGREETAI